MNIKKIGLTALAGSLMATSAFAVEYSMSGAMTTKYSDQSGTVTNNADGIGLDTDLTFSSSGELDNGFTVSAVMVLDTQASVSNTSSQLTLGMGSLGTLQLNQNVGSKTNAIDDVLPYAYNETWDGLSDVNPSFFGDQQLDGSVDYRIPALEYSGATINASVTYDFATDKAGATSGSPAAGANDSSTGYTLQIAHDSGLEIGGGYIDANNGSAAGGNDEQQVTAYAKYAMGPFALGYQEAYQNTENGGQDKAAKMWSVVYTAGDLSVSYGEASLTTEARGVTTEVEADIDTLQAAYTMGAMTISAATSDTSNSGATPVLGNKYEENEIAVSFAF